MCPVSLKFENKAHLGQINLKIMPTLGTSGPQRHVLYSASKVVNSSVGLCFFVATYRNDSFLYNFCSWPLKRHIPKKKKRNISVFFAPIIACFPQK